jgi:RNA polymerase sigma-70 factor, ECF subfamily
VIKGTENGVRYGKTPVRPSRLFGRSYLLMSSCLDCNISEYNQSIQFLQIHPPSNSPMAGEELRHDGKRRNPDRGPCEVMEEGPIDDGELRSLMTRYQSADRAALEELVRRLSPPLLRYFAASGIGREDAEDLVQDCWMRIHRARNTYRSSEPVLPWLYAIARHTKLDGYRKRRRRQAREVLVAAVPENLQGAESPAPSERLENDEIGRLLAGLPGSQREVILMLKVSGMSLEEAARATGSTVGAVKQKAHRAYQALRRVLAKEREDAE